ncbi:MAG: acetoacetate--CoA ligase family protein, partial [Sandaracinaceae bacterium]|nr:acetoacetate--CoA ligase family protein [Sandaracinaceae bacterium]
MTHFREAFAKRIGQRLVDSRALHRASVENIADFWDEIWDVTGVVGDKGERRLVHEGEMIDAE